MDILFAPFRKLWEETVRVYRNVSMARWLVLGILAGLLSGVAAILFFTGIEYFKHLFLGQWASLDLPAPAGEGLFHGHVLGPARIWAVPVLTTLVGLVTGWLVERHIPEAIKAGTDGTDAMIKSFHQQQGNIRPPVWGIRGLTSILTIASGGSAGREGPISQICAGIGCWLANTLHLSAKDRRILLLAGAAGGLGAIFRAPMGGALTAIEVIYREDFESDALLPAVLSSVVAYSLNSLVFGTTPILGTPPDLAFAVSELPFYVVLALFCSLTGWFYVRTFYFVKYKVFFPLHGRIGIMWTMALGGLIMGLIGMGFPQVLSGGYGWLELAIHGNLTLTMLGIIIFMKTIATAVTLGSGMSGGMFAPALFVGGMSGGVIGFGAAQLFPGMIANPGAFVLVGMATFFAGVANAPIGPLFMVCELTGGYALLAPLMLSAAICLVINRHISLYENQVDNKFDSPAHIKDKTMNLLEGLQVRDFYSPGTVVTLEEGTTLKALTNIIAGTTDFYFPVKNESGDLTGILAVPDVRQVMFESSLFDLVLVRDLARKPTVLRLDDDLYSALLEFVETDLGQIPVVGEDNEIIGSIHRENVFKAYSSTLKSIHEDAA